MLALLCITFASSTYRQLTAHNSPKQRKKRKQKRSNSKGTSNKDGEFHARLVPDCNNYNRKKVPRSRQFEHLPNWNRMTGPALNSNDIKGKPGPDHVSRCTILILPQQREIERVSGLSGLNLSLTFELQACLSLMANQPIHCQHGKTDMLSIQIAVQLQRMS